jgi:hypothetical protein
VGRGGYIEERLLVCDSSTGIYQDGNFAASWHPREGSLGHLEILPAYRRGGLARRWSATSPASTFPGLDAFAQIDTKNLLSQAFTENLGSKFRTNALWFI